jgi:hypothetical protein
MSEQVNSAGQGEASASAEPKAATAFRLEGPAFDEVKKRVADYKMLCTTNREAEKKFRNDMWDFIHNSLPATDRAKNYMLDTKYEDLGLFVVKEKGCGCEVVDLIVNELKKAIAA